MLPASSHFCIGLSLLGMTVSVAAQTPGTSELLDITTQPAVVIEGQDFELVVSGFNLGALEFWDDVVVDRAIAHVNGFMGGINCFSAGNPPRPPNDRPSIIKLPVAGLPARTYRIRGSWDGADCNGPLGLSTVEKEFIVYPQVEEVTHFHESPRSGDVVSGVGVIRGWACYPPLHGSIDKVTFTIDDYPFHFPLPHGSERSDTASVCGGDDYRYGDPVYSGYGGVVYWPTLGGEGEHTINIFINGVQVDSADFYIARPPDTDVLEDLGYRKGAAGEYIIDAFLGTDESVKIRWSQADQNFIIVEYN